MLNSRYMTLDEFGELLDKKLEEKFDIKLGPIISDLELVKNDLKLVKKDLANVKEQMATKDDLKMLAKTIAGYLAKYTTELEGKEKEQDERIERLEKQIFT